MKKILSLSSEIEAFMILPMMAYFKTNMVGVCLRFINTTGFNPGKGNGN
jgi:hypothetical protein